ncbi:glucosaminidase domain-containing protein [Aliidiomarina haloalkalitolerans]|uniref:Peptidoglycan hydrolase n=1 Tax=Aliidiomarina haloalkalitolerans TaxID=859059 RepID=A0A432VYC4_9GAMM|nr:glucosaminidase domain-containing protein [Aliidiomarina haloalkalitolerans]RUO21679.1 peptidoglycan hydrolase [Aliidiomarina haloalkalitolerans]
MKAIVNQQSKLNNQRGAVLRTIALVLLFGSFIAAILVPFVLLKPDHDDKEEYRGTELPVIQRPIIAVDSNVPDFSAIQDVTDRKIAFFNYLIPSIDAENAHILALRATVQRLHDKYHRDGNLARQERRWLRDLASYYRVEAEEMAGILATLLRRVDEVPDTLVLIQAANESGWGTSRFAQDARNFFGQWCWVEGCGIVPNSRPEGAQHEVQYFESVDASIQSYMRNLNTHFAYQELREIRAQLRSRNIPITAQPLTLGLMAYSERGEDYIVELNQMIRVNREVIQMARME